ncbi:MAG: fibronectin type III domain-containing protein [Clostridia bacterium]|nr:fibronectin type III domain-containing protein [Clostridia bacterium]
MKKTLALLMTLALVLSCIAGFAVNSSAAVDFVEETYSYDSIVDEYGNIDGLTEDTENKSYNSETGFSFCDGLWSYEYYLTAEKEFKPMVGYYPDCHLADGWLQGGHGSIYVADPSAAWTNGGLTYCGIMGYKFMHPGEAAGAVITYTVPASGNISYDFSIFANADTNHPNAYPGENWGTLIYVFINDEQVYPAANDTSGANRIGYHTTSKLMPLEVSLSAINVKAGDKIRAVAVAYNGFNDATGVYFESTPTVTYHSADVPVGNPNGTPPTDLVVDVDKNTNDSTVTWTAATDAASYNVYLKKSADAGDAVKVNTAPVTETTFTLTGMDAETMYEVYVTTVTSAGKESAPSDSYIFKTKKGADAGTSDNTDNSAGSSDVATNDSNAGSSNAGNNNAGNNANNNNNNNANNNKKDSSALLWIIIAVAAAVVVAVVVVVVIVLAKKKKPALEAEAAPEVAEEPKDAE